MLGELMRVSTFCPKAFPGVNSALTNLSEVVAGTVHSNENIKTDCDLLILGGWVDEYQFILNQVKDKPCKKAVWFTSSLGQSGLTPNLIEYAYLKTILKLLDTDLLDFLFVGGRKIYYPLRPLHKKIQLLPFPFNHQKYAAFDVEHKPWRVIFFAPKTVYKNVPNQLIALSLAQQIRPELDVHVNNIERTYYSLITDIFPLRYASHGWLPDSEYWQLIGSSACSLQITYAEVCNYSAMTSMAMGTPTLLSNVVDWIPHTRLNRNLIVGRFDSPEHIAEKILHVAEDPDHYSDHVKRMITHVAQMNNRGAIEVIKAICE